MREVPPFEQYVGSEADRHQSLPSRFHPVPTRNVFQPPLADAEGFVAPLNATPGGEVLPPPQESASEEYWAWPPESVNPAPEPTVPHRGPTPATEPSPDPTLHRNLIQYPYNTDVQRNVSDWVRGNYPHGPKPTLRLHSALQPAGGADVVYR
jgi:hypothetical protein